jgi:hypothetical protein
MSWRRIVSIVLIAAILSLLLCFSAALLLSRIDTLIPLLGPKLGLSKKEIREFTAVFSQLRGASFRCPVILTLFLSAASVWLVSAIRCKKTFLRMMFRTLLSLFLIAFLFLTALLLTKVNTIRFMNVLLSLLALFL